MSGYCRISNLTKPLDVITAFITFGINSTFLIKSGHLISPINLVSANIGIFSISFIHPRDPKFTPLIESRNASTPPVHPWYYAPFVHPWNSTLFVHPRNRTLFIHARYCPFLRQCFIFITLIMSYIITFDCCVCGQFYI